MGWWEMGSTQRWVLTLVEQLEDGLGEIFYFGLESGVECEISGWGGYSCSSIRLIHV